MRQLITLTIGLLLAFSACKKEDDPKPVQVDNTIPVYIKAYPRDTGEIDLVSVNVSRRPAKGLYFAKPRLHAKEWDTTINLLKSDTMMLEIYGDSPHYLVRYDTVEKSYTGNFIYTRAALNVVIE